MSGSQHKKQEKARRKAEREKARQEERRRNLLTAAVVVGIIVLGGVLVALSIGDDGEDVALEEPTEEASADDASETPTEEGPAEVVPDDPSVAAGEAVDSGLEPQVDTERAVACDAEPPANVDEVRPQFPGGPAEVLEEGVDYAAVVETSCGTLTMDLLEEDAPETVNSFVFLAQQGFFDGLEIFRNATSIGALQTGGGDHTNTWGIGYSLPDELGLAESDGYPVGSVAMANSGPDSGGSQFFFVYNEQFDTAFTDQRAYAVFGQVTDGMDTLTEIGDIPVDGETPTERVYITSVTIEER